jgi:hypothetical protein
VLPLLEALLRLAARRGRSARSASDLWPNLRLYLFSGSPLLLYRERIQRLLGEQVRCYEVYSSTESPFAFQHRFDAPDLIVDPLTCFLELQPADASVEAPRLRLDEVEVGVPYRVVPTTVGGLFAWRMGDVIEFTSTAPYLVRFRARDKEELSVGPEHMTLPEAKAVLDAACAQTGARAVHFFVCPAAASVAHDWCVEFEQPPRDPVAFACTLDRILAERNRFYALARESDLMIQAPALTVLEPGIIDAFVASRSRFGQTKFLSLYATRALPDELLAFARERRAGT